MTTTFINHGTWTRYVPDVLPEGVPRNVMFCKRDADGKDWYDFIYNGAVFAPASIKLTVMEGVVRSVNRDASFLFPQGSVLLEITGDTSEDPQAVYGGYLYDATAHTLTAPPPPPPPVVSPRQLRLALNTFGLRQAVDGYVNAQSITVQDSWNYATQFDRNNALIAAAAKALNKTDAELDALFALAKTL